MRLRRVAVSGFKTFARRSEVSLEPGITAIVGPNGSGKSNLVDAIRWALGETNARELRGARMDEVIYAGGDGRPRMGFAEVELVLDNEDGRLSLEDAEVVVSRRVARHGDSDFRLNGDRVRLRDLERVLGATGLTQSGYAVVAQNDIDAIIEASPAQRRALVEQAAGVRSLRAAVDEALRRVGQAEATLLRFEDLLRDAEPRLAELAAQADLARQQRELSEQLGRLRGSLAREAWRSARAQLRLAQRRLDAAGSRFEAAAAAEAAFASRLAAHRDRLDRLRAARTELAGLLEDARLRVERAEGERSRSADRARAAALARAAAAADLRAAAVEEAARIAELADAEAADASAAAEWDELGRRRAVAETARDAAADAERAALARLGSAEASVRAAEERRADADARSRRNVGTLSRLAEAEQALRARVEGGGERLRGLTERAEAEAASRSTAESAAAAAVSDLEAAANAVQTARQGEVLARSDLDAAREVARAALARAATLRGQLDGAIGGRGAVAAAVEAGELSAGRLVDAFSVTRAEDAAAVEAALELHLGAWLVADVEAAAAHLDGGSAREQLLLAGGAAPGETPVAPPGVRAAITAVLPADGAAVALHHCLAGAWLAPDLATARAAIAAAGGRAILPDGTVVTVAGLRGGGRPGRTIELAAHERVAADAADRALDRERAAEAARSAAARRLSSAETAERRALEEVQAARIEAAQAAARATAAAELLAGERRQVEAERAELAAAEAQRTEVSGAQGDATALLAAAERELLEANARLEAAREELAGARDATATATEVARELDRRSAAIRSSADERARRLQSLRAASRSVAERREAAAVRLLMAELEVLGAGARALAARATAERSAAAVRDASASLGRAAPDLAAAEAAVVALELERAEVAVVLARAEDERAAAEAEVGGATERVAELAEAVRGDEEDDGPEPQAGDAERAEREIVRIERRVASLGPVNALAPEQHERLAARVAVLRAGRDDLRGACADLRVLAGRLADAIDSRFEAVFGAVCVHFHDVFAELFPGGRATLRREQPVDAGDDASDAPPRPGVEILAQPPGKRLQPLSLFSGGERALTALAVILALQQVNPSPFYVFDEVDAPLDDSNVVRFTRLLKRLSATQQFIVVTHNHITMAAADALHGVTSDAEGISSVISVRFDAASGSTIPEANVVGLRQSTIRAAV